MKKTLLFGAAVLLSAAGVGDLAAQANTPPPAPAPGSPAIFRSGAEMMSALQNSIGEGGAMAGSGITQTDQYRGSFVYRSEPNGAIVHQGNTELHYIVEGSGTVETGGTVIRTEGQPARIEGGESHRVVPGDIVIIPAGSPHRYSEVFEPITYLEWRWVAPE